jgi:hypothetical protein
LWIIIVEHVNCERDVGEDGGSYGQGLYTQNYIKHQNYY